MTAAIITLYRYMDLYSRGQTAKDIDDDWDDPDCMIRSLPIFLKYYGKCLMDMFSIYELIMWAREDRA